MLTWAFQAKSCASCTAPAYLNHNPPRIAPAWACARLWSAASCGDALALAFPFGQQSASPPWRQPAAAQDIPACGKLGSSEALTDCEKVANRAASAAYRSSRLTLARSQR